MPKKLSSLQTLAVICTQLEQGVPEEEIREKLDLEDNAFLFYVEFALENNWLIKEDNGKYVSTNTGKEFLAPFQS